MKNDLDWQAVLSQGSEPLASPMSESSLFLSHSHSFASICRYRVAALAQFVDVVVDTSLSEPMIFTDAIDLVGLFLNPILAGPITDTWDPHRSSWATPIA